MNFTNSSSEILNSILTLEKPVNNFFDSWFSPGWILVLASVIIAACVAVKVNKHLSSSTNVRDSTLFKIVVKETWHYFTMLFGRVLFYGAMMLLFFEILRTVKKYSPELGLILILVFLYFIDKQRRTRFMRPYRH